MSFWTWLAQTIDPVTFYVIMMFYLPVVMLFYLKTVLPHPRHPPNTLNERRTRAAELTALGTYRQSYDVARRFEERSGEKRYGELKGGVEVDAVSDAMRLLAADVVACVNKDVEWERKKGRGEVRCCVM